jgi:putative IMPACT (imprinted ancient) family translation regulator
MTNQPLFTWFEENRFTIEHAFLGNVITDRWSKYSVSWGIVTGDKTFIKHRISQYLSDKYFAKATHNSYAYRIRDKDGILIEWKNDDGETGAGQCILTVLQRENIVDGIVVVTRYFWWVQLHGDRFRHVIDATKKFVEEYRR